MVMTTLLFASPVMPAGAEPSCGESSDQVNKPDDSVKELTQELTFDDVFGEHNPKMIGGWGGSKHKIHRLSGASGLVSAVNLW